MERVLRLSVFLLLVASSSGLHGEGLQQGPTRTLDEGIGFSVNALGVQHTLDAEWRWRLTDSQSPLRADSHFSLGLSHAVTPAYTRLGGWLEISPLSILDLRAGVEPGAYFGTFGSLLSFDGYRDPFDDHTRDVRKADARAATGSRLYVSSTLKMRVGSLVALGTAGFESWRSSVTGPFYYEPSRDTLLKSRGDHILTGNAMLLRQFAVSGEEGLAIGISHNLMYVPSAPENQSQRIGAIVVRQFGSRRFGLHAPKLGGEVSYYLNDPSRRGQVALRMGLSWRLGR